MRFEWDAGKARSNVAKHGVAFDLAITVFDDPFALLAMDDRHSTPDEQREWIIGESDHGVCWWWCSQDAGWAAPTASSAHDGPTHESGNDMKTSREFPFDRARRVTKEEVELARRGIQQRTGVRRQARGRGRPPKPATERYRATSIRLHPKAIAWARREARKRNVGYQTIINEVLLEKAG